MVGMALAPAQPSLAWMGVAGLVATIGARVMAETGFVDGQPDTTGRQPSTDCWKHSDSAASNRCPCRVLGGLGARHLG